MKHNMVPDLPSVLIVNVSFDPLFSNTSQSFTVLSQEPLANMAAVELKHRQLIGPSWPASTCKIVLQIHSVNSMI